MSRRNDKSDNRFRFSERSHHESKGLLFLFVVDNDVQRYVTLPWLSVLIWTECSTKYLESGVPIKHVNTSKLTDDIQTKGSFSVKDDSNKSDSPLYWNKKLISVVILGHALCRDLSWTMSKDPVQGEQIRTVATSRLSRNLCVYPLLESSSFSSSDADPQWNTILRNYDQETTRTKDLCWFSSRALSSSVSLPTPSSDTIYFIHDCTGSNFHSVLEVVSFLDRKRCRYTSLHHIIWICCLVDKTINTICSHFAHYVLA